MEFARHPKLYHGYELLCFPGRELKRNNGNRRLRLNHELSEKRNAWIHGVHSISTRKAVPLCPEVFGPEYDRRSPPPRKHSVAPVVAILHCRNKAPCIRSSIIIAWQQEVLFSLRVILTSPANKVFSEVQTQPDSRDPPFFFSKIWLLHQPYRRFGTPRLS